MKTMRPFHFILGTTLPFLIIFCAACESSNHPAASAKPSEFSATVTVTLASTTSVAPAAALAVSPVVRTTTISPAATPPPTTMIKPSPSCSEIGQSWTSPQDEARLICVPAGEFIMGAAENDPQAQSNEKPQRQVYLDAFWIDHTEVTNANFAKCMAAGACHPKIYETSATMYTPYAIHPDYQDFPALVYEADVAAAYCQWAGRRLPTEAEWEKAARGTDGRSYPWGNELDCTKANYYQCDIVATSANINDVPRCGNTPHCRTTRVDDYLTGASPYGVLNLAGNVWEWVADWYSPAYYSNSPSSNPTGPDNGEFKVRRGGGNKSLAQDLRVTARASGSPQHYFDGQMGFRCAVSASRQ